MYYPKQIPYLLDRDFKRKIEYLEYHPGELRDCCMCIWTMKSKQILDETVSNLILPDACVDLVIDFTRQTICFAGFSKETEDFQLNENIDYLGARLKPGAFYMLFGVVAEKAMDHEIPFEEIEKQISLKEILSLKSPSDRIEYLKNYLLQKIRDKTKFPTEAMPITAIVESLYNSPKDQNVLAIAKELGYNGRQLYRVFKTIFGVSPKVLLNILRLHLCLTLMLEEEMNLADIANSCGFYDQSHLIREVKRYTGFSPLKILKNYQ